MADTITLRTYILAHIFWRDASLLVSIVIENIERAIRMRSYHLSWKPLGSRDAMLLGPVAGLHRVTHLPRTLERLRRLAHVVAERLSIISDWNGRALGTRDAINRINNRSSGALGGHDRLHGNVVSAHQHLLL